jgi:nucleoside-diphosphate-sugar epimerase
MLAGRHDGSRRQRAAGVDWPTLCGAMTMNVLLIGGTGLIGTGIVKHLLGRGARVTLYSRHRSAGALPAGVTQCLGDRSNEAEFVKAFEASRYDVVVDMICFSPDEARSTVRAFSGRCEQLQFCSTVCTYGVEISPGVLVDETSPQRPISSYGRDKVACERIFERAHSARAFKVTILRPSHTYGPGGSLIDQLEGDSATWDRVARGLPVLCAGDGLGLWQSTHRDDCGKLFAHAALNPKTYGEAYNATRDEVLTWRGYYRAAARALDARAELIFVPASWLLARRPERFAFLREITQFHGAYSSAKGKAHVPEFRAAVALEDGARETFADQRRRNAWRDSTRDADYQALVDAALGSGFTAEPA